MMGRFGRRFGPPFGKGEWEGGWTPPWMQPDGPGFRGGPGFYGPRFHGHWGGWGPGRGWSGPTPEQQALRSTAAEVARLFMIASRSSMDNPEKQAQLRSFLERSRKELSDLIYGSSQGTGGTRSTGGSPNE